LGGLGWRFKGGVLSPGGVALSGEGSHSPELLLESLKRLVRH